MKKTLKKEKNPAAALCTAYLCLLGVALPLTVHDAYFDITRTKATVFWLLAGAFALGRLLCAALRRAPLGAWRRFSLPDALFAVFALTHILSTLLFSSSENALLAPDNRFQGVLSFALYLASFLLLRRGGELTPLVRFALLLGFSVAAALGIAELFGADPLGLRALSPERELIRFLSTVGNISFFSALCVLFLPAAAWWALSAGSGHEALPFALCALLALWGGMASRAEGFVLGALAFFSLLPLLTREARALRRVPLLWASAAAAAGLFCLAMRRFALYRPSELTAVLCSPAVLLPLLALGAGLYALLRRRDELAVLKARKVYIILFLLLFLAGLVFLLSANTALREKLPERIAAFAVFSPSWGSDRGKEWMSAWAMFRAAPPLQKLIGSGAGSLAAWDRAHRLFPDAVTDSAHNEYLHYLLTGGVIGLCAYLGVLLCALRRALRAPTRGRTALVLACAAYAVQAAVNIAQPFTTPLFFALLALLLSDAAFGAPEERRGENETALRAALASLALGLLLAGSLSSRAISARLAAAPAAQSASAASFPVEQNAVSEYTGAAE